MGMVTSENFKISLLLKQELCQSLLELFQIFVESLSKVTSLKHSQQEANNNN